MADKLSFKISATDDSKNAFNSAKKNLKDYKKEITELLKKSQKTESPFQNVGKHLKNMKKDFKNINKSQDRMNNSLKKMSNAGDDLADTLKSVNKEDEMIAQKMAQKGKAMQQSLKSQNNMQNQQSTNAMQQATAGQKGSLQSVAVLKVDKIEAKRFLGKEGGGQSALAKQAGEKLSTKLDKTLSDGLGKIGAGIGMGVGGFIAAIGVAYSVMAAKAQAFKSKAMQQGTGLQQLGFGATEGRPGQKTAGGFYAGYKGQGPGGNDYFLSGQQQVSAMTSYAGQTGAGKGQLEKMMYGKQGGMSLGALTQAYGLDVGKTAGTAGLFQRFGRGEGGMSTLTNTMRGAERSGMGGARMKEFMDSMQEAVTQGVMSGSNRTNASMLKGLETLAGSSDERLKALAPGIMSRSSGVMNQAAGLQGGGGSNLMFQAALSQSKGKDIFGVMEQLTSGDWLENAQNMLKLSKEMGGDDKMSAFIFSKAMNSGITSPKMQQELMSTVEQGGSGGKKLTKAGYEKFVGDRLKSTAEVIERTTKQNYLESINTLSDANRDAAKAVDSLREIIQGIVNTGYEKGRGAMDRFFGANLGPMETTDGGYK